MKLTETEKKLKMLQLESNLREAIVKEEAEQYYYDYVSGLSDQDLVTEINKKTVKLKQEKATAFREAVEEVFKRWPDEGDIFVIFIKDVDYPHTNIYEKVKQFYTEDYEEYGLEGIREFGAIGSKFTKDDNLDWKELQRLTELAVWSKPNMKGQKLRGYYNEDSCFLLYVRRSEPENIRVRLFGGYDGIISENDLEILPESEG